MRPSKKENHMESITFKTRTKIPLSLSVLYAMNSTVTGNSGRGSEFDREQLKKDREEYSGVFHKLLSVLTVYHLSLKKIEGYSLVNTSIQKMDAIRDFRIHFQKYLGHFSGLKRVCLVVPESFKYKSKDMQLFEGFLDIQVNGKSLS